MGADGACGVVCGEGAASVGDGDEAGRPGSPVSGGAEWRPRSDSGGGDAITGSAARRLPTYSADDPFTAGEDQLLPGIPAGIQ